MEKKILKLFFETKEQKDKIEMRVREIYTRERTSKKNKRKKVKEPNHTLTHKHIHSHSSFSHIKIN